MNRPSGFIPMGEGGEFDIVRRMLSRWGSTAVDVGSDVAILRPPEGVLVASTDASIEGRHFRRGWISPWEIGWRSTMAALSDLAAAGASPFAILLSMQLPTDWVKDVDELADGIGAAADAVGAQIIGGDTTGGDCLGITATVMGSALRPLSRVGAVPGDGVFLTGDVGRSRNALLALMADSKPSNRDLERFARPTARIAEGIWLAEHGATAAIDISDGVASEVGHLAAASNVRLSIDLEHLPVASGIWPLEALRSGEEYELMVSLSSDSVAAEFRTSFDTPLARIGTVVAGPPGRQLRDGGVLIDFPDGHDHF